MITFPRYSGPPLLRFDFATLRTSLELEEAVRSAGETRLLLVLFTSKRGETGAPFGPISSSEILGRALRLALRRHSAALEEIDFEDSPEVAARLRVRRAPTVVALVEGEERDRLVGPRTSGPVIEWLEGLQAGRTEQQSLEAQADDPDHRARLVSLLLERETEDDTAHALAHFEWLWTNTTYRFGKVYELLTSLCRRSPAARAWALQERDTIEASLDATGADVAEQVNDLVELNEALGARADTKAWLELSRTLIRALPRVPPALRAFLIEAELWRELGLMLIGPVEECRELLRRLPDIDHAPLGSLLVPDVRALVAAGRTDEAQELAALARSLDPSPELVAALDAAGVRVSRPGG